ncbi:hypothetical protein SOVF_163040 [Spinacia oleracea]|nr:hypothetical protein SOVF_163040 [Spinacia oleracea]
MEEISNLCSSSISSSDGEEDENGEEVVSDWLDANDDDILVSCGDAELRNFDEVGNLGDESLCRTPSEIILNCEGKSVVEEEVLATPVVDATLDQLEIQLDENIKVNAQNKKNGQEDEGENQEHTPQSVNKGECTTSMNKDGEEVTSLDNLVMDDDTQIFSTPGAQH